MNQESHDQPESFIKASESLPEITLKAIVLSMILTVALAAANAYLGLKVGSTISASIPAAVISMAVLRLFRHSNILENNIVQTAASSGEALVAGISFIVPALILMHYWSYFNYLQTVIISLTGGFLGILFSVFLRRVLLAEKTLRFPEGTAIANVLKASAMGKNSIEYLIKGSLVGGFISFCQSGLEVLSGGVEFWFKSGNSTLIGLGCGFDAALIAAGYIVGINVALSAILGIIMAWVIGVPYFSHMEGLAQPNDLAASAMAIWQNHLRYIGVGIMLVGGVWTLLTFIAPMIKGIHASFAALSLQRKNPSMIIPRTDRDLPVNYASWLILVLCIPIGLILWHYTTPAALDISQHLRISIVLVGIILTIVGGFLIASVCGYFTGLVGSSNNPLSGMALSALIIVSLILYAMCEPVLHFAKDHVAALHAAAYAIVIGSIIASTGAITNDTIQDLKTGQIVGATPWKQQFMLMVGSIVAALTVPLILNLLFNAYGIGGVYPRAGMDPKQMLSAPQAALMASLVQGIFGGKLPWHDINIGIVIAIFCALIDTYLKRFNHRLPVLAVALGVYLPLEASMPLVLGGLLSYFVERNLRKTYAAKDEKTQDKLHESRQRGLILACGLVAGAALMGVILAIPFAIAQSADVLRIVPHSFTPIADTLGIITAAALLTWMYRVTCYHKKSS